MTTYPGGRNPAWRGGRYVNSAGYVHVYEPCPLCHARHVDAGEFVTKPHHTHACQACGMVWRPAVVPTVGVQFLPGFKDVAHT